MGARRVTACGTARAVEDSPGCVARAGAIEAFHSIQVALSALDRLEVRGRDSAGLHVLVTGHGLDLADPTILRLVAERSADPLFTVGLGARRRRPPRVRVQDRGRDR